MRAENPETDPEGDFSVWVSRAGHLVFFGLIGVSAFTDFDGYSIAFLVGPLWVAFWYFRYGVMYPKPGLDRSTAITALSFLVGILAFANFAANARGSGTEAQIKKLCRTVETEEAETLCDEIGSIFAVQPAYDPDQ